MFSPTAPLEADAASTDSTECFNPNTTAGLAQIALVRERFMDDPTTDLSAIRPRIADSWRRSAAMRVDPGADLTIDTDSRIDEQTLRCAEPYVRELERLAFDAGGDVTVITPNGRLVHDLTPQIENRYPAGMVLLESVTGTNGDGTAIEDGRGGWVYSQEHYRPDFAATSCYTVLIRDPFRDNVRACVTLTLPEQVILASDARAVALAVEGMAAKVTREIGTRSASREQMLFGEYLKLVRRYRNAAVLATDGKHTTVTDPALELLREDDFAAVCSYAQETLRLRQPTKQSVRLSGGRLVRLCISLAGPQNDPLGAIVIVKPEGDKDASATAEGSETVADAAATVRTGIFHDLVGQNPGFRKALDVAETAARRESPVHVIGERGTGKRSLALRLADQLAETIETIDASSFADDPGAALASVSGHLSQARAVVICDADLLSNASSLSLADVIAKAESPRVVLTLTRPTAPALSLMSALNTTEVAMPSLRARREDIPALTSLFISGITAKKPSARLLYVLSQADWPGNITQLRSVVEQAAIAATGAEINTCDLPQSFHAGGTGDSLSRLEKVELHELRSALYEADGNRSLAAEILQIGRSTLYRRLDSYRRRGIVI